MNDQTRMPGRSRKSYPIFAALSIDYAMTGARKKQLFFSESPEFFQQIGIETNMEKHILQTLISAGNPR